MLTVLTPEEFIGTMSEDMNDVTETEDVTVDIWPYVAELANEGIVTEEVFEEEQVEIVYRNQAGTYDHVLLPTTDDNVFIALVIDLEGGIVMGHYRMELDEEAED
jgi:hypothetical protein